MGDITGGPMAQFIYVNNPNLLIEGRRLSGKIKGIRSTTWSYDFRALYEIFSARGDIGRSAVFASRSSGTKGIWQDAERAGFEVTLLDSGTNRREVGIDVAIASMMARDSAFMTAARLDHVVLVSGTGNYRPAIEELTGRGIPTTVAFWEHATSLNLRQVAAGFMPLDRELDRLTLRRRNDGSDRKHRND